ncbi:mgtE protein, partial [human gut metagenome]
KQGENAETVYTCYVVERNRLLGVVSARSLLLSDPSTPIVDIMDDNVVTVKVTDDQEFVAREMQRYDFTACLFWTTRACSSVSSPSTTHRRSDR